MHFSQAIPGPTRAHQAGPIRSSPLQTNPDQSEPDHAFFGVFMNKQHFTYTIERTIEIEVECVYYPSYGETEILRAIDCATGKPVELDDDEASEVYSEGTAEFQQGLEDDEADRKYEDWKLDRMERDR
jgi:hypothetical protein